MDINRLSPGKNPPHEINVLIEVPLRSDPIKYEYDKDSGFIFDLGMNNGDDTDYYLRLGYDVVAVEANPALCERASKRFPQAVADGRLKIVNAAVWETSGETNFFVNLQNDHWSSIDIGWAGRDNAFALAHAAGSRNMGLMLAASAGLVPELVWLYVALAQFPIYLLPLAYKPLARKLGLGQDAFTNQLRKND